MCMSLIFLVVAVKVESKNKTTSGKPDCNLKVTYRYSKHRQVYKQCPLCNPVLRTQIITQTDVMQGGR